MLMYACILEPNIVMLNCVQVFDGVCGDLCMSILGSVQVEMPILTEVGARGLELPRRADLQLSLTISLT